MRMVWIALLLLVCAVAGYFLMRTAGSQKTPDAAPATAGLATMPATAEVAAVPEIVQADDPPGIAKARQGMLTKLAQDMEMAKDVEAQIAAMQKVMVERNATERDRAKAFLQAKSGMENLGHEPDQILMKLEAFEDTMHKWGPPPQ